MRRLSNQPPRDIAAELRAEIAKLREGALLRALMRKKAGGWPRSQVQRARIVHQAHIEELALRQPQIARLERKLARLEGMRLRPP